MAEPTPVPAAVESLLRDVSAKAAVVQALKKELATAEQELRKATVKARRGGALVRHIQGRSGWSHEKLNQVLREGGIPADRSAPRK
jgi:hypothetical protein